MNEFELRRQLRGLAQDREPAQDLWPEIARRLPARQPQRRVPGWAIAATAVLGIGVALSMLRLAPESPSAPVADAAPIRSAPLNREADLLAINYRAALSEVAARPLPLALRPAAAELDASVREIRGALREAPESRLLLDQLRRTYELRLRLGQRAALS